jgi:hypothetical protein
MTSVAVDEMPRSRARVGTAAVVDRASWLLSALPVIVLT